MQSMQEMVDFLSDHSPAVAYDLVQPLSRVLTLMHERSEGDLERALLMLTITLRSSAHPDFKRLDPREIPSLETLPSYGTNISSLADATDISRETARRKVYRLIDDGWVRREGNMLHYTPEGYAAVSDRRDAIIAMFARGHHAVGALLRTHEEQYRAARGA